MRLACRESPKVNVDEKDLNIFHMMGDRRVSVSGIETIIRKVTVRDIFFKNETDWINCLNNLRKLNKAGTMTFQWAKDSVPNFLEFWGDGTTKYSTMEVKYKTYKGTEITPTDQAEVQVTVPGTMEIGRGDIFTLLKAEQKGSFIGRWDNTGPDFYQAPFFSISELIRIEDSTGLITDAVIQNNDEILFTTKPTGNFSCLLKYNPSFMIDDNPDPRNAENKIFPRKSVLKRMDVLNTKTKSPRFDDEVIY